MMASTLIESKCFICSASFDARSLPQHERECLENLQDNLTTITKEVDNLLDVEEVSSVKSATSTGSSEGSSRKTVRCYICGNDFPTHFISLHEKQCKRKWESGVATNDNLKKGSSLGNISTVRENGESPRVSHYTVGMKKAQSIANVSHREPKQAWNARLREDDSTNDKQISKSTNNRKNRSTIAKGKPRPMSAYASLSMQNLNSSYSPRNEIHIFDDTRSKDKGIDKHEITESISQSSSFSEDKTNKKPGTPRFTECKFCLNRFSVHSISIHEKKCRLRDEKENKTSNKPIQNGRCASVAELALLNDEDDWLNGNYIDQSHTVSSDMLNMIGSSDMTSSTSALHKSRFFQCHICGKLFGSKSLPIHVRQCEKAKEQQELTKSNNEKARLPRRKDKRLYHSEMNLNARNDNNHIINHNQVPKSQKPERVPYQKNDIKVSNAEKKRTPTGNNYVRCHFCNNYYGSASINIHEVKCGIKMEKAKEDKTPKNLSRTPRKQCGSARRLFDLQR